MDGVRPCTLLEELDIEASIVEHRRGELYRLAAKRIRELEAVRPEENAIARQILDRLERELGSNHVEVLAFAQKLGAFPSPPLPHCHATDSQCNKGCASALKRSRV